MYITRIQLKNIRCFENFSIDLEENGKPILWTMILGENSVGKSVLLRSIALGLCDEASAAALMKEIPGDFLWKGTPINKDNSKSGSIEINFRRNQKDKVIYKIVTEIKRQPPDAPEKVKQTLYPKGKPFPWEDIFVCGYGPQRASDADHSYDEYDPLDAVYTLFNYEGTLQNPELIFRRQHKARREAWKKRLLQVLMLDGQEYRMTEDDKGMYIEGAWGKQPLWSLSDGYKSMTFLVMDFLAWQIYFRKNNTGQSFGGVALIDEIEQHLHPRWQRQIVGRLKYQFPKIQFIVTTHSPLVVLGLSEVEGTKVVILRRENTNILWEEAGTETFKNLRADQILTSDLFGLAIARAPGTEQKILRLRELSQKGQLSDGEKEELRKIKAIVRREMKEVGESEEERQVQRDLAQRLAAIEQILKSQNGVKCND